VAEILGLMRHAKSAYPDGVKDHDRPLAERGQRDALAAGPIVRQRMGTPDLVVVSTAKRAQQTWTAASRAWTHPPQHINDERIYDATTDDLLLVLREIDSANSSVLVVGHNPGMEELAFGLTSEASNAAALATMSEKFPTCALAKLNVSTSWSHLIHHCAALLSFDVPRG